MVGLKGEYIIETVAVEIDTRQNILPVVLVEVDGPVDTWIVLEEEMMAGMVIIQHTGIITSYPCMIIGGNHSVIVNADVPRKDVLILEMV